MMIGMGTPMAQSNMPRILVLLVRVLTRFKE